MIIANAEAVAYSPPAPEGRTMDIAQLLASGPKVVNVGLDSFARDLKELGVAVRQVDWQPPAGGKPDLARLLSKLGT